MQILFASALILLLLPLALRLLRRTYTLSLLLLLLAGISFSQKPTLNPINRMFFTPTHNEETTLPLDSDADGLPDEIEKSGYYPLETGFTWQEPAETDLFQPWQRFTVSSDYKSFPVTFPTATNLWSHAWVSPAGYLAFGKPLNAAALQDYPLLGETNTLRRLIPQIAFCQGQTALIPQLGSKFYASANTFTFEKLFLSGSTNLTASIQATLRPDGSILLAYQDITGNLAATHRIGWQINGGGMSLPIITNHTALILHPFTPTDPFNSDSDGDGLTDYEELFTYGSDPQNPSTANDLLSDGWKALHGLSPATPYLIDTSTDCFGEDWPDQTVNPDCGDSPIAITLEILTNRPAWVTLTWSGALEAQRKIPIAGSTEKQTLSLPLPRDGQTILTAIIQPATNANGPWRRRLAFTADDPAWPLLSDDSPELPCGLSTLPADETTWIGSEASVSSVAPLSIGPPPMTEAVLYPLSGIQPDYGFCVEHGHDPVSLPKYTPWISKIDWGFTLPKMLSTNPLTFIPADYAEAADITYSGKATFYSANTNAPPLRVSVNIHFLHAAAGSEDTVFVGAESRPNHAPDQFSVIENTYLTECSTCREVQTRHIAVGFTHTYDMIWQRNLGIHPLEPEEDKKIMHTTAYTWAPVGMRIALDELVTHFDSVPEGDLFFEGDDVEGNELILMRGMPGDFTPHIYRVFLRYRPTNEIFDRLFIIVHNDYIVSAFSKWRNQELNDLAWLNDLPPPPLRLPPQATEATFNGVTWYWSTPNRNIFNTFYHHTARAEIRSSTGTFNSLTCGHQACYNANGDLITSGVSAGTADKYSPENKRYVLSHWDDDVKPYLWALILDGNPISVGGMTSTLPHPLIHVHQNGAINDYLQCRPPHTARR